MFGFIKNLFAGIFGFLGRLLGLKKSEYFMELADAPGAANAAAPKASKPEPVKAAPAKVESAKPQTPAPAPAKAQPAKAQPAKAEAATKNNSKAAEPAPAAKTAPANQNGAQPVVGFATTYYAPSPGDSRRRPGANMNSFLDMARQVKTSK